MVTNQCCFKNIADALPLLELCKQYLLSFEVVLGSMDEAFIAITGKEIRE